MAESRDSGAGVVWWMGERLRDVAMWPFNLVRDLPGRLLRLLKTLWDGLAGIALFVPQGVKTLADEPDTFGGWLWERLKRAGAWLLILLSRVLDLVGLPEVLQFFGRIFCATRPLTDEEIAAARSVLGPGTIRYGDVRVAERGFLTPIFNRNQGRPFTAFHTICLPEARKDLATMVHELVHVFQHERVGCMYAGEALYVQAALGDAAYHYGGPHGLRQAHAQGQRYRDYNREQQAKIAEDFYKRGCTGDQANPGCAAYDPFIAALRAGEL